MLILYYNRMFGNLPDWRQLDLPWGTEVTEDRRRMQSADVVIFHLPTLPLLFRPRKRPGQLWVAWSME